MNPREEDMTLNELCSKTYVSFRPEDIVINPVSDDKGAVRVDEQYFSPNEDPILVEIDELLAKEAGLKTAKG